MLHSYGYAAMEMAALFAIVGQHSPDYYSQEFPERSPRPPMRKRAAFGGKAATVPADEVRTSELGHGPICAVPRLQGLRLQLMFRLLVECVKI